MAFESIKARIGMLMDQARDRPEDQHELHQQVMQQIGELRGFGLPVPDDLLQLEQTLEASFAADMGQRGPPREDGF